MEHSSAVACVQVAGTAIEKITYRGQQVVTFAMIDQVHRRVNGTAKDRFNSNRQRFVEGEDFVLVTAGQKNEFHTFEIDIPNRGLTIITRRGYLKIVKSLNDDLAWAVFDQMIERYFAAEQPKSVTVDDLLANPHQLLTIAQSYAAQVENLKREKSTMVSDVHALQRIAGSNDLFGLRETAKMLHIQERQFVAWLQANKWAFRRPGTSALLCFADKDRAGLCRMVGKSYRKSDGTPAVSETLKFTGAGLVRIAKAMNVQIGEEDMFRGIAP